jgi:phosphopantothenate synthetase
MISINEEIRKAIGKTGGDKVTVSLYLHTHDRIDNNSEILKCFEDAGVLDSFRSMNKDEQNEIITEISSKRTEAKQIEQINHHINELLNQKNSG